MKKHSSRFRESNEKSIAQDDLFRDSNEKTIAQDDLIQEMPTPNLLEISEMKCLLFYLANQNVHWLLISAKLGKGRTT